MAVAYARTVTRASLQRLGAIVVIVVLGAVLAWQRSGGDSATPEPPRSEVPRPEARASGLPPEARETLERIERGGPFLYRQDGVVFQNREGRLPSRPRGYYHEYTVPTPGESDRGARRIITGGEPPREYFYTSDHYRSFRQLERTP
jgi:guanyl-specific ribonuclease Sa